MKGINKMVLILGLLFTSTIGFCQQLEVSIVQDGQKVSDKFGRYQLQRSPFTFQIKSNGVAGFLIGATGDEDVYQAALGNIDHEVAWFENTGMADEQFNSQKTLTLSNDAPSYWYFASSKDHRFDYNAKGNAKSWIANRTVDKIEILESNKLIAVRDLTQPIYIIFYQAEYDEDYFAVDRKVLFKGELVFL